MSNFYLNKYGFLPAQISDDIHPETNIIIVIPCFNEPDVTASLMSLAECDPTINKVEVIIVLNSGELHPQEIKI